MRCAVRPLLLSVVLLPAAALAAAAAPAADSGVVAVELKNWKFKVPEETISLFGHNEDEKKLFFLTNGTAEATVKIDAEGEYEIVVTASCDAAQNEKAKFKLSADDKPVGAETTLTADEAKEYKFTVKLAAGDRKLAVQFTNDAYKESEYDRNLYVHKVTVKKVK